MKKLYLLLTSSLILLTSVGTLTTTVAGCRKRKTEDAVIVALKNINKNHPLTIPFLGEYATASANNDRVATVIHTALQKLDEKVFTLKVVEEITFGGTHLKPGSPVKVAATYQKQKVPIFVKESENIKPVYDALAYFTKTNPLPVIYQEGYKMSPASSNKLTKQLRLTLGYKRPDIFTKTLVSQITFGDKSLKPGAVVGVSAIYRGKKTTIYVKEDEKSRVSEVIEALKFFHNKDNVIELSPDKYSGKFTDESSWGDFSEKAGDAIREYIFENTIDLKSVIKSYLRHFFITFDHKELIKNTEPIEVKANYLGKSISIWVKLGYAPRVKKVLKQFTQDHKLKLTQTTTEAKNHHQINSNEPYGTKKIRDALVAQSQGLLTQDLAIQITFTSTIIAEAKQNWTGGPWIPQTVSGHFEATFHKKVVEVVDFITNEPALLGH